MSIRCPKQVRQTVHRLFEITFITPVMASVLLLSACGPNIATGKTDLIADIKEEKYLPRNQSTENKFFRNALKLWDQLSGLNIDSSRGGMKNTSLHPKSTFAKSSNRVASLPNFSSLIEESLTLHSIQADNLSFKAKTDVSFFADSTNKLFIEKIGSWALKTQVVTTPETQSARSLEENRQDDLPANTPEEADTKPIAIITPEQSIGMKVRQQLLGADGHVARSDRRIRENLDNFYAQKKNKPLWVTRSGLGQRARRIIREIRQADEYGLNSSDFILPNIKIRGGTDNSAIEKLAGVELTLSLAVLEYVRQAMGGRVDPRRLSPSLDIGSKLPSTKTVMEGISRTKDPELFLRSFHPKHPQFEALRVKYLKLRRIESKRSEVQRILVNMERWRWMPSNLGKLHVWLSIPEFEVRVVKNGNVIHSERAVVGKVTNQTPVFSDKMEYIVFHPYWAVPDSIKVEEILPELRRSANILQRHNLKIKYNGEKVIPSQINWNTTDIRRFDFYQPPGRRNVLGVLKFIFPNRHSAYIHDTPTKKLFDQPVRMFSHGCMRIRNPQRFAEILLNEDKGWPAGQIDYLIRQGVNHRVHLSSGIPVHITYFTAWVEADGQLKFYQDYYGHDRRIAAALTGRADLIPIADIAEIKVTGSIADPQQSYAAPDYRTVQVEQRPDRVNSSPSISPYWSN